MEDSPAIIFTREEGEADREQVELLEYDLPTPPIQWGGKLDETVTRYSHGEASVQVHGIEFEPVQIEGVLSDERWDRQGHALEQKRQMLALMHTGGLVRMEYGEEQLWGTFSVTFEEKRRDYIGYAVEFRPYWQTPPEYQKIMNFSPAPTDEGTMIFTELEAMHNTAGEPPGEVNPSLATQIRLATLSALNKFSAVMNRIGEVTAYFDFNAQTIGLILRDLRATHSAIRGVSERLRGLLPESISEPGIATLRAQNWTMEVERSSRELSAEVLAFIRAFVESVKPATIRTYVVARGDTLQSIARELLGDFSRWMEIADLNDLDTTDLEVGQVLEIGPR